MESHSGTFQKMIYYEGGNSLDGTRMQMPVWEAEHAKSQRNQIEEKLYEYNNF